MSNMELIALGNFIVNAIHVLVKIKKERKKDSETINSPTNNEQSSQSDEISKRVY